MTSHFTFGSETAGFMKVIHSVLDAMYAKAPYTTITRAMHIHPTVAELVPTTLQDLTPLPD